MRLIQRKTFGAALTYLRWLLAYFEGDVALVAAAYNAGEGKVERYRGVPPYQETRAYVQRILKSVGAQVHPFDASVTRPSPGLGRQRRSSILVGSISPLAEGHH